MKIFEIFKVSSKEVSVAPQEHLSSIDTVTKLETGDSRACINA